MDIVEQIKVYELVLIVCLRLHKEGREMCV